MTEPPDHLIEVNEHAVRRSLVRSFNDLTPEGHAWRGTVGVGDAVVEVDVLRLDDGRAYMHTGAAVIDVPALDPLLARTLVIENGELVLGRFRWADGRIVIEHAILAGTHMAAVEVQASVWTVGWAASSFAPRLRALLTEATPVPPPPETPAGLRRDAAYHVDATTKRVEHMLQHRYGGFEYHPAWGFHGGFGSARVFVDVLPVLDDSTAVRASSPVVSDVELSDELALHLLELTGTRPFGGFLYIPSRREVWFQHAILGDDLDEDELDTAIDVVAAVADDSDDVLVGEFGGRRYADLG
ncbi:MAG: T3SS (YopN, CesT) and YbjN peptide-binding chaperone 1 [Gaiellales bacterium]